MRWISKRCELDVLGNVEFVAEEGASEIFRALELKAVFVHDGEELVPRAPLVDAGSDFCLTPESGLERKYLNARLLSYLGVSFAG